MDRGHRALLVLSLGGLLGLGVTAGKMRAQAVPTAGPTPWVQAPPAASGSAPDATPAVTGPPGPKAKPGGMPGRVGPVGSVEDTKAKMERERQRELKPGREEQAPDERQTFEQNLQLWDRLSREEKQAIRDEVGGRIRQETELAYQQSGLNLNNDQREVFALRYRQERRKAEREVQEVARRERERLLPPVIDRLRKEFARESAVNAGRATAAAGPASKPSPAATPGVGEPPAPTPKVNAVPSAAASPAKA